MLHFILIKLFMLDVSIVKKQIFCTKLEIVYGTIICPHLRLFLLEIRYLLLLAIVFHCAINTVMCLSALLFDMVCLNVLVCQWSAFPYSLGG
uniref:Uncharacterized protein n=1 Tax=Hyaloperonospora arabidopsidis (strain Emoy2) TaxID=559515 RepID=M4BM48_HYAAE